MSELVYKRRISQKKQGGFLMAIPSVLAAFLGVDHGGRVALIVDTKAPVPSITLRKALEEAPGAGG